MEDGELDGAVWRLKHVQQYPLPSDLSHNPSQGTCHGNKAVAVIAVRATLLSPAFVRLIRVITQWFEEGAASAVPPLLSSPGVSSACVAVRATSVNPVPVNVDGGGPSMEAQRPRGEGGVNALTGTRQPPNNDSARARARTPSTVDAPING